MTKDYLRESIERIKQEQQQMQSINVTMPYYSEELAIENLLKDADDAFSIYAAASEILVTAPDVLATELDASTSVENIIKAASDVEQAQQFTICINGKQHAFMLGAAQYDALIQFVKHITSENIYDVDYENNKVTYSDNQFAQCE